MKLTANTTAPSAGDCCRPLATIVVVTRNRRGALACALASCFAQNFRRLEVLVIDDASTDGTSSAVASQFPQARLITRAQRVGLIVNRNRGFAEARGDLVFSLDDDAYFTDPLTVSRTVAVFAGDASVAAVALPYVEPAARQSRSSQTARFAGRPGDELRAFVGCAHALRRDAVLALGGYRDFFVHQVEERDLSMRLWANGWRIVCGEGGPVVHNVDPRRDHWRVLYYGCRNQVLNEILNTPAPPVLWRLPRLAVGLIQYRFTWSSLPTRLYGLAAGLAQGIARRKLRRPMPAAIYRRYRSLPRHGPAEFAGPLPPPCRMAAPAPALERHDS